MALGDLLAAELGFEPRQTAPELTQKRRKKPGNSLFSGFLIHNNAEPNAPLRIKYSRIQ
jgi:hypothetical protein